MGQLVIKMPTPLPSGVIDGTSVEVARCGDLWIPMGEYIEIEQKGHLGQDGRGHRLDGISVSSRGGDSPVIAGRYQTPGDANQIPSVNNSNLGMMRRDELEIVLRACIFQMGGRMQVDAYEFMEVKERSLDIYYYQDPFQVKVQLL